jgi:hypothetical protein
MRKTREKPAICEYFKKPLIKTMAICEYFKKPLIKTMAIHEYLFASFKE